MVSCYILKLRKFLEAIKQEAERKNCFDGKDYRIQQNYKVERKPRLV